MTKRNLLLQLLFMAVLVFMAACGDDEDPIMDDDDDDEVTLDNLSGEVSGVWEANGTYTITGNVIIPEGESLTIEEGATIIVAGDGLQGTSPEISLQGSLYCYGTEENRILFTVPEGLRTDANCYTGLWGGILATSTVQDLVLEYTDLEFAGAPAEGTSPIVQEGELDEGEPRYAIYFQDNGLTSNFILWHSSIRCSKDDAVRLNGGKTLWAYNTFENNGETGGECLNAKSGTVGDFCYNLMFASATNGLKVANSKGREPQADNYFYNNTILNSGWRRNKSGRGGSLNFENGARGLCYNNLIVNSRYGLRMVPPDDQPDLENTVWGHQFYYGDEQEIVDEFYPSNGTIGQEGGQDIPDTDIAGGVGENDPLFVNYSLGSFDIDFNREPANVTRMPGNSNFRLQSGSPALSGGNTDFTPRFATYEVNGKVYTTPGPSTHFGAFDDK